MSATVTTPRTGVATPRRSPFAASRDAWALARRNLIVYRRVPTLLVWGEADPIIPVSHAYEAHEAMPGSRLEVMPGLGHYPHCEDPRAFARILLDFIAGTEPAAIDQADLPDLLAGAPGPTT